MSVNSAKQDELQREVPKKDTLIRMYRYLLAYKKTLVFVTFLILITLAVTLATPLMIERAVDVYVANSDVQGLMRLAVLAFILFTAYAVSTKKYMVVMADVTNKVLLTIRQELYEHIQTLSFHFFDSRPTGKILARVVGDVNSLKEVLSDSVTKLLPDLLTVIGVAVIMLLKNWQLALATLLMIPVLAFFMFLIQLKAHKLWQIHRKKNSNLNAFIHEDFSGIRIVQSFAAEEEKQKILISVRMSIGTVLWMRCGLPTCLVYSSRLPGDSADFCSTSLESRLSGLTKSESARSWHLPPIWACSGARSEILRTFIIRL